MFQLTPLSSNFNISVIGGFVTNVTSINPGITKVVDDPSMETTIGAVWYLAIVHELPGDLYYRELSTIEGVVNGEEEVDYNQYGILGDTINYDFDVTLDSGKMKLSITNLEAQSILVKFNRIII